MRRSAVFARGKRYRNKTPGGTGVPAGVPAKPEISNEFRLAADTGRDAGATLRLNRPPNRERGGGMPERFRQDDGEKGIMPLTGDKPPGLGRRLEEFSRISALSRRKIGRIGPYNL